MGLPPELKAVAPDQMRAVLEAAALVALRLTKSKRLADELLSDVFDKLTTTRRWDRSRGLCSTTCWSAAERSEQSAHQQGSGA